MARASTGKWVTRAGATGGGSSYRGQRPVNWYGALVVIVLLGVVSVIYSRFEYRSAAAASSTPPTVGTTWYAGFSFDICGSQLPPPATSVNASKGGLFTSGSGVITIQPKTSASAGNNATLGKFVSNYAGMVLTATSVRYPGRRLFTNGMKCARGTPDAGKVGQVRVEYWKNYLPKTKPVAVSGDPASLKLGNNSLVTIAFLPQAKSVPKPSGQVVLALLQAPQKASAPTTPSLPTGTPGAPTGTPGAPGSTPALPPGTPSPTPSPTPTPSPSKSSG